MTHVIVCKLQLLHADPSLTLGGLLEPNAEVRISLCICEEFPCLKQNGARQTVSGITQAVWPGGLRG